MFNQHLRSLQAFSALDRIKLSYGIFFRKLVGTSLQKKLNMKFVIDRILDAGGTTVKSKNGISVRFKPAYSKNELTFTLREQTTDTIIFKEILLQNGGDYNPLKKIAASNGIAVLNIIDAGANIGCASVYLHSVFPEAKILAIEPEESNFNLLSENLANLRSNNVQPVRKAMWVKDEMVNIGTGPRGTRERELSFGIVNDPAEQSVPGITFQTCLAVLGTDVIDILKIDIEGAEKFLIEDEYGFSFLLQHTRILAIELHEEAVDVIDFAKRIEQHGFHHVQRGEIFMAWK